MKRHFAILLTLAVSLAASAQSVRLTPYRAPTALYLDAYRFFNYSLYEHARFEAGLTWVLPNESTVEPKMFLGQWSLNGYAAYGIYDKAFKYGGGAQLWIPGRHDIRFSLSVKNDLERAASRKLEGYRMASTSLNSGYLASRFSSVQALEGKVQWKPAPQWGPTAGVTLAAGLRYSREQQRFDSLGMILPPDLADRPQPWSHYAEASLRVDYTSSPTAADPQAFTLVVQPGTPCDGAAARPYLRTLAQYSYGKVDEGLHFWAQTGFATREAPVTRLFDLSGTGGTPYYFEHTLLTIRPDRFVADLFAQFCAKYTAPLPLWDTPFSRPRPFLQINAVWGRAGEGSQAPDKGLVEPATGFDGILRWGILDMGFAVAYQLTPASAGYRSESPADSIAFAIVARLIN